VTAAVSVLNDAKSYARGYDQPVSDELERVSPRENAHVKARDKKVRGPKVISVNPGVKKLAQHLAEKRKKKQ
jgi:hypothetical protein